jgi:CheY-like chemotaxis protein
MERPGLQGRSILIVEDNPIIVMDVTLAFEHTGAALTTTNTLKHALLLVGTMAYRAPSWIMRWATRTAHFFTSASMRGAFPS